MDNVIRPLKGADRVRKRPAVIFGSADSAGALEAVKTLIRVLMREAILGYSPKMMVTLHSDSSITVHSYDRGLLIDEGIVDGRPAWENLFCELPCFSRDYHEKAPTETRDLLFGQGELISGCSPDIECAFDLCCVQYVSEYMTVSSVRDGVRKTVRFQKGTAIPDVESFPWVEKSETVIHFKIDSDVFGDYKLPSCELSAFLNEQEQLIDGLSCELILN